MLSVDKLEVGFAWQGKFIGVFVFDLGLLGTKID